MVGLLLIKSRAVLLGDKLKATLFWPHQVPDPGFPVRISVDWFQRELARCIQHGDSAAANNLSCEVHPLIVSVVDEGVRLEFINRRSEFLVRHGLIILEGAEHYTPADLRIGAQDVPYGLICLQTIELDRYVVTSDTRMWECPSVKTLPD